MAKQHATSIGAFLPEHVETKLVQARVPTELHALVRQQIGADQAKGIPMDWTKLFIAAARAYLAERGVRNVP